jgi:hypothetical protein
MNKQNVSLKMRLRQWWRSSQWLVAGLFVLVALVLGFIGFSNYFAALGKSRSAWDVFYLTLQLFVLESGSITGPMGWQLEVARLLAPLISAWAAVRALAAIFRDQYGVVRARFLRGHAIICGLGRKGALLARHFHEAGWRVLAIEPDSENDSIHALRQEGIIVLNGDATDPAMIRKAGLRRAGCLIAVAGDDGRNSEIAIHAADSLRPARGRKLSVLAHIVQPELYDLLRERASAVSAPIRLEYFNIFASGARAWLRENPVPAGTRLLVVGLGHLGEHLIVQAANDWRLRLQRPDKLPITIIDREAISRVNALRLRNPRVGSICDLQPIDLDVRSSEFQRAASFFSDAGHARYSAVFVCFDQETLALKTALSLKRLLEDKAVPITVRFEDDGGLARLLSAEGACRGAAPFLRPFALLDRTLHPDLLLNGTHEVLARAIHEEYLEKQVRESGMAPGDPPLAAWDELPESVRESNRRQADHIGDKLRAVGCGLGPLSAPNAESFSFTPEEIETLAELEHERWCRERRQQGWRFAAGAKDGAKQTSPYLVPYSTLPDEIKDLDRNTVRKLPLFLAKAGFQVRRSVW